MRSTEREIEQVDVSLIDIGERHRTPTDEAVERLAKSMGEIGLQCPILIRVVEDDEGVGNAIVLVAGATRLAAAKRLGWQKIDTIEIHGDDILAEMVEIAENLHRLGLTKEQRNEHIRRYAELLRLRDEREAAAAEQKTVQNDTFSGIGSGRAGPGRGHKGIASQIAADTGLSKSTVNRALNPKPPAPTATPAYKPPVPPPSAPLNDFEAINKQVQRIMSAWNAAGPEARERFLGMIDNPVMDSSVIMREFVDRETGEVLDEPADTNPPSAPSQGLNGSQPSEPSSDEAPAADAAPGPATPGQSEQAPDPIAVQSHIVPPTRELSEDPAPDVNLDVPAFLRRDPETNRAPWMDGEAAE